VQLHHIELGNLEQSSVNDMLATTLSLDSNQIDALAETVFSLRVGMRSLF
jgi:predicted ATPase